VPIPAAALLRRRVKAAGSGVAGESPVLAILDDVKDVTAIVKDETAR
jgi:hypothetical protein